VPIIPKAKPSPSRITLHVRNTSRDSIPRNSQFPVKEEVELPSCLKEEVTELFSCFWSEENPPESRPSYTRLSLPLQSVSEVEAWGNSQC
jgi:hypothetical protein